MYTNLLLGGLLICQLSVLLFVLVAGIKLKSYLLQNVRSFFEQRKDREGNPEQSAFADILDNIGNRLAAAIIASAKGWLMAQNSAAVRQDKAAARQEFQASAPAALQFLMKFSPGIGKIVQKNPELAQLAMSALGNMGGKSEAVISDNGNGHISGDPFKI